MRGVLRGVLRATAAVLAAALAPGATASAQLAWRPGTELVVAPAYQSWNFAKAVPLDSLRVRGASQLSLPFSLQLPLSDRWTASLSGAAATSSLDATNAAGSTVTRTLTGLTDMRLRATGRVYGELLQLTVGLNIPTGVVGLSPSQNDVLRVVAAPALEAQVPVSGLGFGGTVGAILAKTIGAWGWAAGASVEHRGRYSPVEAQIAGLQARTELVAGQAVHLSLGTDGLLGANRLTVGIVGDLYGNDRVRLLSQGTELRNEQFQLGPTVSANATLQVPNTRLRDLTLRVNERYRSAFTDAKGLTVGGSSGNYFDVGASGLVGSAGRPSLLVGLDVRQHTGLAVNDGFIGAGLTAVGATLGASIPSTSLDWRPSVHASVGTLRTGRVSTGITALTLGLTVSAR